MNVRYALTSNCAAITALLISLAFSARDMNASSESLHIQLQERSEWGEIIDLYKRGLDEYQKETKKKKRHKQSEVIFRDAAVKLTSYIDRYVKDINSLKYLRVIFRLGTFWEYANNDEQALRLYAACASHPLIKDARSLFESKPLAPQVQSRLEEVSKRLNKLRANNSTQTSGTHVIKRSSKGGSKGVPREGLPLIFTDLEP